MKGPAPFPSPDTFESSAQPQTTETVYAAVRGAEYPTRNDSVPDAVAESYVRARAEALRNVLGRRTH